jgi:hypothetical protein
MVTDGKIKVIHSHDKTGLVDERLPKALSFLEALSAARADLVVSALGGHT